VINRQLTALFAALEALLVVAIGIAIPLAPLTILWGVQFGFALDWTAFWRASVDIWLIGHGVDTTFTLDPTLAAGLGLPAAGEPVVVTIAALGFALLTILLGVRAGRRVAETRYRLIGEIVALAAFAVASFVVTFSALDPLARPSLVQGTILPTLVFALGLAIGVRMTGEDPTRHRIHDWIDTWPLDVRTAVVTALRGGTAAAAAVILAASLVLTLAILASYARIITLYEGLHTEVLGGIAVTLGQLAFLPNFVIWTASWLVGPGFAIGTGSVVSPIGTQLGPIPAIPLLGALPTGDLPFGFVGLVIPIAAGFLVGAILGPTVRRVLSGPALVVTALGMGIVGGVILGLLAGFSAGAAGPGRLQHVGPDPWIVGGLAALELSIAALIGLVTTLRKPKRQRAGR
jgi:hypothetical protein